jgi:hypothetical protein
MHQEHELPPIACNPTALSAALWAAHQAHGHQLFQQTIVTPEELPDGYAFSFPATVLLAVAAFVENERRCCPFFTFTLVVPPGAEAITLAITGNPEAKVVIAAELLQR